MFRNNYEDIGNPPLHSEGATFVRVTVPVDEHRFLPRDLVQLAEPTWSSYPDDYPLSAEEVRTLLWLFSGNIGQAAEYYRVPPARLRAFVQKSPYVVREVAEIRERLLDLAEHNVYEAMFSGDPKREDSMARFVLTNSVSGRQRLGNIVDVKFTRRGGANVTWLK